MLQQHRYNSGNVIFGLILIALGALFLIEQTLRIDIWHFAWPFFIVAVGLLFFFGMLLGGKEAGPLAVPASIITTVGLILLYQNTFEAWASWAYVWLLIAPTSLGIGLFIHGWWSARHDLRRAGAILTPVGLTMFALAGAFFELAFGIFRIPAAGQYLWPLMLIALGVLVLFWRSLSALWSAPSTGMTSVSPGPDPSVAAKDAER